MYRETEIDVPPSVLGDQETAAWLREYSTDWEHALDLQVHYLDDRATYLWHHVYEVTVRGGDVNVHYGVEYEAYYGCDDANVSDEDERQISGTLADGKIIFRTFQPPERPAPDEEL